MLFCNDLFSNIGYVGIFSICLLLRSRFWSRLSSGGMGFFISGFMMLDFEGGFGEVSRRIREVMIMRWRKSEKLGVVGNWSESESEGEEGKKDE